MATKEELLQQASDALEDSITRKVQDNKFKEEREHLIDRVSKDLVSSFKPFLEDIKSGIKESISDIKVNASIESIQIPEVKIPPINIPEIKPPVIPPIVIPEIKLPTINIPEIKVPEIKLPTINVPKPVVTVNVPPIKVPDIIMPDEMNVRGWVGLMGVSLDNPLPVQLRDSNGKPVSLIDNLTQIIGGGGGFRHVRVDGTVPVTAGDTLVVDQLSGANWTVNVPATINVNQVSGANWSISVSGSISSVIAVPSNNDGTTYNRDNPLPVVAQYSFVNVTAATATTTVKTGAGYLHTVTINSRGTASNCKLYDNTTDNGNLIATIDTTLSTTAFLYDIYFASGLLAVTSSGAAADLTISYL